MTEVERIAAHDNEQDNNDYRFPQSHGPPSRSPGIQLRRSHHTAIPMISNNSGSKRTERTKTTSNSAIVRLKRDARKVFGRIVMELASPASQSTLFMMKSR